MKFTAPPVRFLIKAIFIAISLGGIAALAMLALAPATLNPIVAFAVGTAVGALFGGWLTGIGETPPTRQTEPKSVFVGNLSFKAKPEELRELFARFGAVHSVRIMTDRATRRPRGFAFVEMDGAAADRAISTLNGQEFMGRQLRVNEGSERRREPADQQRG